MPDISLSSASLIRGDELLVILHSFPVANYQQVQVDIISAGVLNPSNQISMGAAPGRESDRSASVAIGSGSLEPGYYEVGRIRLHTPTATSDGPDHVDFLPHKHFERRVFEIRCDDAEPQDATEILAEVVGLEQQLERKFRSPTDLHPNDDEAVGSFGALVFIRDVLLAVRMRFEDFAVIPTHSGLEEKDRLRFINDFLNAHGTAISFPHDDATKARERQSNPVAVLHFPSLIAKNPEVVCDYCVGQADTFLLALALSRDAGGVVFDIVVTDLTTGESTRFGITRPYIGNLLTGSLSGENAGQVRAYMQGIDAAPMNRFLVSLYKQARRERGPDFQYVRLWQILETMADSRDYESSQPLLDYEDEPMYTQDRTLRRLKGSVHIVYNLLRENQIGSSEQTWKNVNVWFAFRTAVAHHGSMSRYADLSRAGVRKWGQRAFEDIQRRGGVDHYLMSLKENTKLLLMRRLVRASA